MPTFAISLSRHQTFSPLLVEAETVEEAQEIAEGHWLHLEDSHETDDWELEHWDEVSADEECN